MRILFELMLLAIVTGAVFLFYRAVMKKIDAEKKRNRRGFTFIELMIVVAIIAILIAIAVPQFANTNDKKPAVNRRTRPAYSDRSVVDFKCPKCSHELSVNSKEE